MKFLVLALFVCAANAASFGAFGNAAYKTNQVYRPAAAPAVFAAKAVASAAAPVVEPVILPVAKPAVQTYQPVQAVQPVQTLKVVPYEKEAEAVILRSETDVRPDGYNFAYETSNGIASNVVGTLKKVDNEEVIVSQGTYKYVAPDGTDVVFTYVADENGFQPQSNLLPVAPPVPEAIARAIAYTAARAKNVVVDKY